MLLRRSHSASEPTPTPGLGIRIDLSALARVEVNLDACIRWGLSPQSCPTHRLTNLGKEGPGGRIVLVRPLHGGHLQPSQEFAQDELNCLVREARTAVCPARVRIEKIQVGVRETLRSTGMWTWYRRLVARSLRALGNRSELARRIWLLALIKRLGFDRVAAGLGIFHWLGLSPAMLPIPPTNFLSIECEGWLPTGQEVKGSVVLFAGCLMSTLLSQLDTATGELLDAAGYEVEVTAGQTCCGALSAHQGDLSAATQMAERNLATFGLDDRPIAVNPAGCGAFLREYAEHFGRRFSSVAARVADPSGFLAHRDRLEVTGPLPEDPVAFHDPCHLQIQGMLRLVGSDVRVPYPPELPRIAVPKPVRWEPATLPSKARDP